MNLLCNRPNEIMKTQRGEKANIILILAVSDFTKLWLHSPIDDSVERKQIASFTFGFKILHESSYDGVSGTDNDEH